jgi:hypothetical protein
MDKFLVVNPLGFGNTLSNKTTFHQTQDVMKDKRAKHMRDDV